MYICAMWVRAPKTGERAENVVIYRHPAGLPHDGDLERIVQEPGRKEDAIRYSELKPGGNRVQAALDLILDDGDYDRSTIVRVLYEKREAMRRDVTKPVPIEARLRDGTLRGVFTSYVGPLDPPSAEAVFSLLVGAIDKALERNNDRLAA